MGNITTRLATGADAATFAEISARTFYDTYAADNTPEDMAAHLAKHFGTAQQAAELANPAIIVILAEVDDAVAGYAKLDISTPPDCVTGPHPIELARIYADKVRIGKGVGAALMQACLDEAFNRGFETIWLGVWEHNPRGQAFYRKWGFVQAGTQIYQLGGDPQNDFVLQRPVKS